MQSMSKMKLSYHDKSDGVWSLMKTKQDNYVTDCIDSVYIETETNLSEHISPSVVFDEN